MTLQFSVARTDDRAREAGFLIFNLTDIINADRSDGCKEMGFVHCGLIWISLCVVGIEHKFGLCKF